MEKKRIITILLAAVLLVTGTVSCDKWLDVRSTDEIIEREAFNQTEGYRTALVGVYRILSDPGLYGRELSWGLVNSLSWCHLTGYSDPAYRQALQAASDPYAGATVRSHINPIWEKGYNAIANLNELLDKIKDEDPSLFETDFEKDMIMGEAYGLRALLHFVILECFVPAPVTGYTGPAIPYVTKYPDYQPVTASMDAVLKGIVADLDRAVDLLERYDVVEGRGKAVFVSGATDMMNMDYYLFQRAGNWRNDGKVRDNASDTFGFFVNRGYRLNWWGCNALLARVYSYMRDFDNAEKYADVILNDWVNKNNYSLDNSAPNPDANPNLIDTKRRKEQLIAFYRKNLAAEYASVNNTTSSGYSRMVNPTTLFDDANDYRRTGLLRGTNAAQLYSRVWEMPNAAFSVNATIDNLSRPLIPVLELPEIYFIKAECLARKGNLDDALRLIKDVRDARQCVVAKTAADLDSFMSLLVDEAQREFFGRGTAFFFLKKLDWPEMYQGTAVRKVLPEGWYVFPKPESETDYQ